jgi:DNA-binding NarL/FixJ family response regulator
MPADHETRVLDVPSRPAPADAGPATRTPVGRAMVVATDRATRAAWSARLAAGFGAVVVEQYATVADVRARLAGGPSAFVPDLVLVDWTSLHQQTAGLALLGDQPSVVVGPSSEDAGSVLAAGARGYLVATGPRPGPPGSAAGPASPPYGLLSPREVEVLQGLADGLSTGRLAGELGLSPLTIKSHLARITKRLEARNRVHAVLIALRHGLIE